ncbi:MAG: DUF4258 domain-containing protein [Phycisphaerae bacterium]|nr:DUF4258 domain-containing protein [Phycisphaerae bacterium]
MDLRTAILTEHATARMAKRGISSDTVRALLEGCESVTPVRLGRVVVQGVIGGQLLRVFVDVDRHPPEVVTVYSTSKIEKYRRSP